MMMPHTALALQVKKSLAPIYILAGPDAFLRESSVKILKNACPEHEEKKIVLETSKDWELLIREANSYSLFSEFVCINACLDAKTLDANAKAMIKEYLVSPNPKCLVIIHSPEQPIKQWQWLESDANAVILKILPLEGNAFRAFIIQQLKERGLQYEPQVPDMIQQYTEGNPQACVQAMEKLSLATAPEYFLDTQTVALHLLNQSSWQIFDLSMACLQADARKALTILRQAAESKMESTLVLWVLTQEIRLLSQLSFYLNQGQSIQNACKVLKIWNNRIPLYEKMHKRVSGAMCESLFQFSRNLDICIKSGQNKTVWQGLESIALALCCGYQGGIPWRV